MIVSIMNHNRKQTKEVTPKNDAKVQDEMSRVSRLALPELSAELPLHGSISSIVIWLRCHSKSILFTKLKIVH